MAKRAAFIDRDGVLNVDHGYTFRPEALELTPTAAAAIAWLNARAIEAVVVTNQSGVARGLYGVADVDRFHAAMQARLATEGARIDAFYLCPYHPDGTVAEFARDHQDRKPGPGMILRAMRERGIGTAGSFMIGDRQSDLEAAAAAGLPARLIESNTGDLLGAVRALAGD